MYNAEQFKNQWNQFKGVILENFDELTADDIAAINGKREVLISKIQARYGVSKDIAEEQLSEIEETAVLPGVSGGTTSGQAKGGHAAPRSTSNPQVRGTQSSTGNVKGSGSTTGKKGPQGYQK